MTLQHVALRHREVLVGAVVIHREHFISNSCETHTVSFRQLDAEYPAVRNVLDAGDALELVDAHSVLTGEGSESSAERSVCQERLAHFTRAGNLDTPENAAMEPRERSSVAGAPVTSLWN